MSFEELKQKMDEAQFILVGIGEEWEERNFSKERKSACEKLEELLTGKDYFIVTTLEDSLMFETALAQKRIAAPFAGEKAPESSSEERWKEYMEWLMGTLNRKLFILELGEGFANPSVIRWPFEKTACLNLKSYLCRVHEKFPQLPENLDGRGYSETMNSVRWILSMS